jgi:NAD(P)-dependent dehydrogenase (short-subunit alcohol dehydrogenase family)
MKQFRDRTAVITGAASGIGLELARRAAAEGMNLVLADIEGGKLEAAATPASASPPNVSWRCGPPTSAAKPRSPRWPMPPSSASVACTCCATTPASASLGSPGNTQHGRLGLGARRRICGA